MLHLKSTAERQTIYIPRANVERASEAYTLLMRNNVNRSTAEPTSADFDADYSFDFAREGVVFTTGVYYVAVTLGFTEPPTEGEYQYWLYGGDVIVSQGLMMIGEMAQKYEEYEEDRIYEQYEG